MAVLTEITKLWNQLVIGVFDVCMFVNRVIVL